MVTSKMVIFKIKNLLLLRILMITIRAYYLHVLLWTVYIRYIEACDSKAKYCEHKKTFNTWKADYFRLAQLGNFYI